ncbi:MAG: lipoate--protein ligase family protein [Verrucomicrobia bacterium]|nr:lipoate--protein ligase family protein [Verrucomicrobiota bacterium]
MTAISACKLSMPRWFGCGGKLQARLLHALLSRVAMLKSIRLRLLDLTLPTPAANLALDEALLDDCEARGGAVLRFWESKTPFVVVGYANALVNEVNLSACETAQVPVLRRCSGGGTVLQGPGCLNYALLLEIASDPALTSVTGTNQFILNCLAKALSPLLQDSVSVQGDTDLVWRGRKFSGNAQRRRRTHLLFHGTILLNLDLPLLEKCLPLPTRQPAYRAARPHGEFIVNLPLPMSAVKRALALENASPVTAPTLPNARPDCGSTHETDCSVR